MFLLHQWKPILLPRDIDHLLRRGQVTVQNHDLVGLQYHLCRTSATAQIQRIPFQEPPCKEKTALQWGLLSLVNHTPVYTAKEVPFGRSVTGDN